MPYQPRISFPDPEREFLQEKLFTLFEQKGVRMDHEAVTEALANAGALVDKATKLVRFPRQMMEDLIALIPRSVFLAARDAQYDLTVPCPEGGFHTRTGTGAFGYIDPEDGSYRRTSLEDIATWAKLAGKLDHIDFCAFPSPNDAPKRLEDIYALRQMLFNCPKHVWIQPYGAEGIPYLFSMAEAAAGGAEALRERPLVSFITCSLSPLDFKFMDLEIIVQACRRGVPIHACSLPSAGGTTPVTMAGTVLLAAAETLVLLATAQVLNPGHPGIATTLIFGMDMLSGRSLQTSAEAIQGAAAAVNFLKTTFGIPVHTYGFGADSPDMDGQAQAERSLLALMTALSNCDIIGGAGQFEVATTISPLQLIIDNDLTGMIRSLRKGLTIDEETIAWEELLKLQPGSHFVSSDHTFRHCRVNYIPKTFTRQSREIWIHDGKENAVKKAKAIYDQIMAEIAEPLITQSQIDAINSLAEEATIKLADK